MTSRPTKFPRWEKKTLRSFRMMVSVGRIAKGRFLKFLLSSSFHSAHKGQLQVYSAFE